MVKTLFIHDNMDISFYFLLVSTKRGIKIRNIQVESNQSREYVKQDLFLLSQTTVPSKFQVENSAIDILWRELPMSPQASDCEKYTDILFNVQSNLFCCHKVYFFMIISTIESVIFIFSNGIKIRSVK